jgi:hypothetical protein
MGTSGAHPEARGISVSIVAEWRIARNLFPIYSELVRQSGQCPPPVNSFGADDRPESLDAVRGWFDAVDASCPAAQFRAQVEAVVGGNDTAWHAIALHFLCVRRSDSETRKKLAFVLTRYFAICAPPSFRAKSATRRHVADVLQPLIGECADSALASPTPADELLRRLANCHGMADLTAIFLDFNNCDQFFCEPYLAPAALVQATHLHYLLHLVALEIVQAQTARVLTGLNQLRERGIETLDRHTAEGSEKKPIEGLLAFWTKWNPPADIEYQLEELSDALLGLDKDLAAAQAGAPDPRVDAELASLRAVAEKLASQLSQVTQRLQRLESMVDLQGAWKPSTETMAATNKFRVTPPPVLSQPPNMAPMAARPAVRPPAEAPQPATPTPTLAPGNGNYRQ